MDGMYVTILKSYQYCCCCFYFGEERNRKYLKIQILGISWKRYPQLPVCTRDRKIVSIEWMYTSSTFYIKSAVVRILNSFNYNATQIWVSNQLISLCSLAAQIEQIYISAVRYTNMNGIVFYLRMCKECK